MLNCTCDDCNVNQDLTIRVQDLSSKIGQIVVLGRDCGEHTGTVQQHRQLAKIDASTVANSQPSLQVLHRLLCQIHMEPF